jgi:hypothetical protein
VQKKKVLNIFLLFILMPLPSREMQIDKEKSAQGIRDADTQRSVVRLPLIH